MEENMLVPCAAWQEKLAALHPVDLSPTERAALDSHVKSCTACYAALADYQKMQSLISKVVVSDRPLALPAWITQDDLAAKLPLLPVRRLPRNLPPRLSGFLGRQADLAHVLDGLNSFHSCLAIDGMGGVGKTTLAIEVAYRCLDGSDLLVGPLLDAAVWISARGRLEQKRWLNEVLDIIARVLDYPSVAQLHLDEKRMRVNELLHAYQTLVIIDNVDTIDDPELLTWIQQIPEPSKVLVTGRNARQLYQVWTFHLDGLERDDALSLIRYHAQKLELSIIESAELQDLLALVRITHGNPQALTMILGGLKSRELSLHQVLDGLHDTENILDHLITRGWTTLSESVNAQYVLSAMSFFAGSVSKEAVSTVAGVSDLLLDGALLRLMELSLVEVYRGLEETRTRYGLHPLTRTFVGTKLQEMQDWEQEARQRWIGWWLTFTKTHGGLDGMEWAGQYDRLEEEWENLLVVCEWCMTHGQYDTLRAFWHSERLLWMTSIYGYWQERIACFRWICQAARRRGDKAVEVEAMVEQGFTLTQMGRVDEAKIVLKRAWDQRRFVGLEVQVTLAENMVQWYIRTKDFAGTQRWLKKVDRLICSPELRESELPRHKLTIKYYYGVMYIAEGDRNRAETCFKEALTGAQEIGWQRGMIYVQQFLADIARARGKFDEAEALLKTGLAIAERNKDRRRTAYYKRSLAYLELQRGKRNKLAEAIKWAQQALDGFERLGMQPEVGKLRRLLGHLKVISSPPSVEDVPHEQADANLLMVLSSPPSVEDVLEMSVCG